MTINIRKYTDDDLGSCVKLLQEAHDKNFTPERFEWLHKQNPLAPSFILLAEEDSIIIGCYAAIKKQVVINGQIFIGARDVDPVVRSDYQHQGVFTELLTEALNLEEGIDFHFNFANGHSLPGFLKLGWVQIGSVPECFYQIECKDFTIKKFASWGLSKLKSKLPDANTTHPDVILSPDFREMNADNGSGVAVLRSADYLRWRYEDNPIKKYIFLVDNVDNDVANMIIGTYDPGNNTFYAADFLSRNPFHQYSLKWILEYLRNQGISALRTWTGCPSSVRQQMVSNPLNKNLGGIKVLVKKSPGSSVPDDIFDLNCWAITPGDLESI